MQKAKDQTSSNTGHVENISDIGRIRKGRLSVVMAICCVTMVDSSHHGCNDIPSL